MNTVSVLHAARRLGAGLCLVLLALPVVPSPAARAAPLAAESRLPALGASLPAAVSENSARPDAGHWISGVLTHGGAPATDRRPPKGIGVLCYDEAYVYHSRKLFFQPLLSAAPVKTAAGRPEALGAAERTVAQPAENNAGLSAVAFFFGQGLPPVRMPVIVFFSFLLSLFSVLLIRLLYNLMQSERLIKKLLRQGKKTDIIRVNILRNRAVSITRFAVFVNNGSGKKTMSLDALCFYLQKDIRSLYITHYKNKKLSKHAGFEEQISLSRNDEPAYYTLYCLMLSRRRCILSLTDVTEQTLRQQQLEKLAGIDPLTGLYDQQHFKKAINGQITTRSHAAALLLIINLRNFSEIIDRYSYTVGDDVLLGISEQLKLFPHPSKLLGRLEGDTFALLLCDLPPDFSAALIHEWRLSYEISQSKMELPVYGGLSLYPADADNAKDLFAYALFATELAKQDHNARILPFNRNAYLNHLRYREALEAYPEVIRRELFYPIYQPVLSLHTGGRFGYEAFTRC